MIAGYIAVLVESLDATDRAEDRAAYTRHLAEAARWIAMLHRGSTPDEIRERILAEQRSFGRGYLSGPAGERAEEAFSELVHQTTTSRA